MRNIAYGPPSRVRPSIAGRALVGCITAVFLAAVAGAIQLTAEQLRTSASVNMVGGPTSIQLDANGKILKMIGDPYARSQNEPSIDCAASNPLFCLAASNDTRLVNAPGLPPDVTGDSWLGIFWTHNGGRTWTSTVLPGFPQDASPEGMASPLKGKEAAADPTVRFGNGRFYVSGIAFNRAGSLLSGQAKKGVTFVAMYRDPGRPDLPPEHEGTYIVDSGTSGQFLDKPWIEIDVARGNEVCGRAYFGATTFTGSGTNNQSKVMVHASDDCGKTWGGGNNSWKVSESFAINQSMNLALDKRNGDLFGAWRVFGTTNQSVPSQILLSKLTKGSKNWSKPTVIRSLGLWGETTSLAPDQGTLPTEQSPTFRMFRTNMYPSMCITSDGVIRIAFSERKGGNASADSRLQVATFRNNQWTVAPLDDHAGRGNQFMPAIACTGNRAIVVWYDQRNDSAPRAFGSHLFGPLIFDVIPPPPTHTLDVRAAQTGPDGNFGQSIQVSRYRIGRVDVNGVEVAMQTEYNAALWPLFGAFPFIGDYIDVQGDKKLVSYTRSDGVAAFRFFGVDPPTAALNPAAVAAQVAAERLESPVFHAVWADNRDILPSFMPAAGVRDPNDPNNAETPEAWIKTDASGNQIENWQAPVAGTCTPGVPTATKNQNVYTATLSEGLVVGTIDESSAANGLRGYAFFVANTSTMTRRFQATTDHGSFEWESGQPVQTSMLLDVPPNNVRAATVFLSGTLNPIPTTTVTVKEVDLGNGAYLALSRSIVVNPLMPGGATETHNVDLQVHVDQIATVENPIFEPQNPIFDPQNPIFDPQNPIFDPQNPIFDPQNPIFEPQNPIFDPQNPIFDPQNPIFEPQNPIFEPQNPIFEPQNPIFEPQNIPTGGTVYTKQKVTQIAATITNEGNVATGYNFDTVLASLPTDAIWQLVIVRLTAMPATSNESCLRLESRIQSLTNISSADGQASSSLVLGRDDKAVVLVRIYHNSEQPFITPQNAKDQMAILVESQAPNDGEIIPRSDFFGNRPPTAESQTVSTSEDQVTPIDLQGDDPDGDALTYSIVNGPNNGSVTVAGGQATYTPNANFNGSDSFTFRVNDGGIFSNVATVSISVGAVDDAPVAASQSAATMEDTAVAIVLGATDIDNDPLTFAVAAGPSNGTLSGTAPNVTYTPNANFNGSDSFTFTATAAGVESNSATVSITVGAVDDPPTATPQALSVLEDMALGIVLGGSDVEGSAVTFTVLSAPAHGTLTGTAPNLTYIPNLNFNGADTFSFRVSDGTLDSAPASVAITVFPVNDAPVAANDTAGSVVVGGSVSIGVLTNDSDVDDPPTNLSVAAIAQAPLHGTAVVSADGKSVVYTASVTFAGSDSLTYTARDAAGALSNVATVSINTTLNTSSGLLAPYVAPPKKTYNLGQAAPMVWQFKDASGAVIESSWVQPILYVTFTKKTGANATTCAGGTETSTLIVNEDVTGNSNFQYFTAANPHSTAGANTWQFNWQLNPPVTAGCWNARIILDLNGNEVAEPNGGDQVMGPFLYLIKP